MKITCTRKISFCAGHRVLNHESKCANLHGHNYVIWIQAYADELDELGRVIDFAELKEKVGGWIEKNWDHTTLIYEKDTELLEISSKLFLNKPVFICDFNTTAENIANFVLTKLCPKLFEDSNITVNKVVIYETENCYAEAWL